jgi:predicted nucleic acid-binding protein
MVMECALEAEADFVVTGNTRDFPLNFHGVRVVTPRDFLVVLGSSPKPF